MVVESKLKLLSPCSFSVCAAQLQGLRLVRIITLATASVEDTLAIDINTHFHFNCVFNIERSPSSEDAPGPAVIWDDLEFCGFRQ